MSSMRMLYEYKFGFNGQIKDDEIYGEGNTYSAQYWEYDARLGRRWNLDPVDQIGISNYACFGNNPIANVDPYGGWVVGAGFWRNLTQSDEKIKAKTFAENVKGHAFKDKGGWTVNYLSKSEDYEGITSLPTINAVHFNKKHKTTNHSMLDGFGYWSQGLLAKTRGNAYGEGEGHSVNGEISKKDLQTVADVSSDAGSAAIGVGYVITPYCPQAGGLIMAAGGVVSGFGDVIQFGLDVSNENYAGAVTNAAINIIDIGASKLITKIPGAINKSGDLSPDGKMLDATKDAFMETGKQIKEEIDNKDN